jgi:hypothetical protein
MATKSGIRPTMGTGEVIVQEVQLPNGRKIEIASREGADDFVDAVGTDFISTNVFATDDIELIYFYSVAITVFKEASPEKIASGIPESELHTYIEHTLNTLHALSFDRDWLSSGALPIWHDLFLGTVAFFSRHLSFFKLFHANEGMEAVAKFYASRKKNAAPISRSVVHWIIRLVGNILCVLDLDGVFLTEAFGIIEKTGLLGQFIRCVPVNAEDSDDIVTMLLKCLQVVKKKLKPGTPTGDILDAVIAGKDGPINKEAKSSLVRIQRLARLSNDNYNTMKSAVLKICHHCDRLETQMEGPKLMQCQRCKTSYYCNRECQVADWKRHKKMCNAISSSTVSNSTRKIFQTTIWAFVDSNYFDIATEVFKKTQEYNVPKKELLVEIDFHGDAPALQNEFKVWLTSEVLEGSSVADAPAWIRTQDGLRREYGRVTSDDLLVVCRAGNGQVNIPILNCKSKTGCALLSDETMESIGREDYVGMVAYLGQDTTDKYFREKMSGLDEGSMNVTLIAL